MIPWPHQLKAEQELPDLLVPGAKVCLTTPTGGGKSEMVFTQMRRVESSILYTNRRMLLSQLANRLEGAGIRFGIRAAGFPQDFSQPTQLASIQSVDARTIKRDRWPLHSCKLVVIDEAHVNKEGVMCELIERHLNDGAALLGVTATPLGVGHVYDKLLLCGSTSELRACGALVPAHYYAPDEPDPKKLKRTKTGEYTQGDVVKSIMTASIIGRVIDNWHKLNPDQLPTLLFGPGVKESLWLAEQLCEAGIPSAHIDGEIVWMDLSRPKIPGARFKNACGMGGSRLCAIGSYCARGSTGRSFDTSSRRHALER